MHIIIIIIIIIIITIEKMGVGTNRLTRSPIELPDRYKEEYGNLHIIIIIIIIIITITITIIEIATFATLVSANSK